MTDAPPPPPRHADDMTMQAIAATTRALPVVHHRTTVLDGVEVFYRESGPADGPVVLLLHGFPTSSHTFRHLIPLLADRYRVIAPDLPGFGQLEAPDRSRRADRLPAGPPGSGAGQRAGRAERQRPRGGSGGVLGPDQGVLGRRVGGAPPGHRVAAGGGVDHLAVHAAGAGRLRDGGIVVAVAVPPLGRASGAQLNPAVNVFQWTRGRISGRDGLGYVDDRGRRAGLPRLVPQTSTAAPQMPQISSCRRFHRAMGMKNTDSCRNSRMRAHWLVLWHRGHVRVAPGPRCCCLVPKPKKKITIRV